MAIDPTAEWRLRVIHTLQLVAVFAVAALAWRLLGILPGLSLVLATIAIFFAIATLFELFLCWVACRRGGERPEHREAPSPEVMDGAPPVDGFHLVTQHGDEWYERKVTVDDRVIRVMMSPDPTTVAAVLPHAKALIADLPRLVAAFDRFVAGQRDRFPEYAAELAAVRLASIAFVSRKTPHISEWACEEAPSGRIWACAHRDGVFYNFGAHD